MVVLLFLFLTVAPVSGGQRLALSGASRTPSFGFVAGSDGADFLLDAPGRGVRFTPYALDLYLRGIRVRAGFQGANRHVAIEALEAFPGKSNVYRGGAGGWRVGVSRYQKLRYRELYPGIDLLFYEDHGLLEYDFVVSPGADPHAIRLHFDGADRIRVLRNGDLALRTSLGEVVHRKPRTYQVFEGKKIPVQGEWKIDKRGEAKFEIGAYDRRHTLIIDPVISFATLLGGKGFDAAFDAAVDEAGNLYVVGTVSADFPVTEKAIQPKFAGGIILDKQFGLGFGDAFVAKFRPDGSLAYSTFLGGTSGDTAMAVAVDHAGNAYVTGFTSSPDFPVTSGAFQPQYAGGSSSLGLPGEIGDAFVAKLDADGKIAYSSYLGGKGDEIGLAIAVDASGAAVIAGTTSSADFPVTGGVIQAQYSGAPFARGFLGLGDGFVTRISETGDAVVCSTYIGGNQADFLAGVALDSDGSIYLAGTTWSPDFPSTEASYKSTNRGRGDAILAKLNSSATLLVYT